MLLSYSKVHWKASGLWTAEKTIFEIPGEIWINWLLTARGNGDTRSISTMIDLESIKAEISWNLLKILATSAEEYILLIQLVTEDFTSDDEDRMSRSIREGWNMKEKATML